MPLLMSQSQATVIPLNKADSQTVDVLFLQIKKKGDISCSKKESVHLQTASWEAAWGRLNAISHSLYKKTHSQLFHLKYKISLQE